MTTSSDKLFTNHAADIVDQIFNGPHRPPVLALHTWGANLSSTAQP